MAVRVGHLCDPDSVPGLAHFCEHMLFLGTEKYPDENEYNPYLSSHGGSSNAFTDTEDTNYYFDINSDHFEGAVDRFAQFFISPLFTESATSRELKAVDSENSKNHQNDAWRSYQLLKRWVGDGFHPAQLRARHRLAISHTAPSSPALLALHGQTTLSPSLALETSTL